MVPVNGLGFDIFWLTEVGGALFFAADDAAGGIGLWKGDGTTAGTSMVTWICAGDCNEYPENPVKVGGTLFFTASDGANGAELWTSDGTTAGTFMLADIWPGSGGSNPNYLVDANGTPFFTADDGTGGAEIWKSDGTRAGTVMVADIWPASYPQGLVSPGGMVFFLSMDFPLSTQLWKSDGTSEGTVMVGDLWSQECGSGPSQLAAVGDTLFFTANNGTNGVELWRTGSASAVIRLLRNTEVTQIDPVSPPLSSIFPLDLVQDLYLSPFAAGGLDPEGAILGDTAHPLVFYETDISPVLRLVKSTAGEIRLDF